MILIDEENVLKLQRYQTKDCLLVICVIFGSFVGLILQYVLVICSNKVKKEREGTWHYVYTHPFLGVFEHVIREAAKKSSYTNGQAIKALPPPPRA